MDKQLHYEIWVSFFLKNMLEIHLTDSVYVIGCTHSELAEIE